MRIPALVERAAVRLLGDEERATESDPDSELESVIQTVSNQSIDKASQRAAFQHDAEGAVQKLSSYTTREQ